jgi:hypothetical protein
MHDYWFGLVATAFGVVRPLREVTVHYRQHSNNAIGAQFASRAKKVGKLWSDPALRAYIAVSQKQSRAFAAQYASLLKQEQKRAIEVWCKAQQQPAPVRQFQLYRHGLMRTGFLNNLGFMLRA